MIRYLPILLMCSCSFFGIQNEETPKYKVLKSEGAYEIRAYDSYIIAKTTVEGNYKEASSKAFRILAGYIFGKNKKNESLNMTSPVQIKKSSVKLNMTAPVQISEKKSGFYSMSFVMPRKYTLDSLPKPLDESITFEQVETKIIATYTYSWFATDKRNKQKAKLLQNWIKAQTKYKAKSSFTYAGYNPPWTIPFLRKNEVMIELEESL